MVHSVHDAAPDSVANNTDIYGRLVVRSAKVQRSQVLHTSYFRRVDSFILHVLRRALPMRHHHGEKFVACPFLADALIL